MLNAVQIFVPKVTTAHSSRADRGDENIFAKVFLSLLLLLHCFVVLLLLLFGPLIRTGQHLRVLLRNVQRRTKGVTQWQRDMVFSAPTFVFADGASVAVGQQGQDAHQHKWVTKIHGVTEFAHVVEHGKNGQFPIESTAAVVGDQ